MPPTTPAQTHPYLSPPTAADAQPRCDADGRLLYPAWTEGAAPQLVWGQEPPTPTHLPVLYCDNDLYVLDKPAGLPVHPVSRYNTGTVVGRLRQQLGKGFASPVHRLDRETSGVLLCARTRRMAAHLTQLLMQGAMHKEYIAITLGRAVAQRFSVTAPIGQGARRVRIGVHIAAAGEGQQAETHFIHAASFERDGVAYSVWQAFPRTGRRHQIRIHLRHAGLPIVGDKMYGVDEGLFERFCAHSLSAADWQTLQLPRHALHAARISFRHPYTKQTVSFAAPLPEDMATFWRGSMPWPPAPMLPALQA